MADWFVDFGWRGPTNGTEDEPYNELEQLSLSDGDRVFLKRGSRLLKTDNFRWAISNAVTVDAYGVGPKPVLCSHIRSTDPLEWIETEPNVWTYDLPVADNNYDVLGHSFSFQTYRPRINSKAEVDYYDTNPSNVNKNWTEFGEYAMDRPNSRLSMYAKRNPVLEWGDVILARRFWGMIRVNYTDLTVRNIDFRTCGFGVDCGAYSGGADPSCDVQFNDFYDCYRPIMLRGDGVQVIRASIIANNYSTGSRSAGINLQALIENTVCEHNVILDNGHNYSLGAIYIGNSLGSPGNANIVRDNYIDGVRRGNYWPADGDGIFFDGQISCEHYEIYRNTVRNVDLDGSGLKDNSAAKNCKIYSNWIDNAARGIQTGNSSQNNSVDAQWFNNVCLNIRETGLRTGRVELGGTAQFRNNIFIGNGAPGSLGHRAAPVQEATMDEDYNCFYNFETVSQDQPLGANSLTANPMVTQSGQLMAGSPCINAGDDAVLPLDDFAGEAFTSVINIGAYERVSDGSPMLKSDFVGTHAVTAFSRDAALSVAGLEGQQMFNAMAQYGQTTNTAPLSLTDMVQTYVIPNVAAVDQILKTGGVRGHPFMRIIADIR